MKKENQRVALTKRMLKEALLRLLQTEELNKINISQLCREANINRVTFYHHYTTPRDVLIDIATGVAQDLKQLSPYPQTPAQAEEYLEGICRYLKDHTNVVKVLIRCEIDSELAQVLWDVNTSVIFADQREHASDELDEENFRLVTAFLICGSYHMLREWLVGDIDKTPKEIAALICQLIRFDYLLQFQKKN